jgi:predicted negative regulator of RcsB-dependent stress response
MVGSPKRISRKDLRQPDQFITFTRRFLDLLRRHRGPFLASLALVILGAIALWGWDLYLTRHNRLAAQEYTRALGLFHNRKYLDASQTFARVAAYRWSTYRSVGLLYQANSHIALQEFGKAVPPLKKLLHQARNDPFLRQLALLSLAHAHERSGQWREAAASFAEAAKSPGPFQEEALLGKGRSSLQAADLKQALASYQQHLATFQPSDRSSEARLQIQELEARIRDGSGGK